MEPFARGVLRRSLFVLSSVGLLVGAAPAFAQDKSLDIVVASVDGEDMDPIMFLSAGQTTYYPLVFDALITKDPETGQLAPGLAESWELDEDGKSWIMKLR